MRNLPSVDRVLAHPAISTAASATPRTMVVKAVRSAIEEARQAAKAGKSDEPGSIDSIASRACEIIKQMMAPSLKSAINATGVIIHTGLGRSVLAEDAVEAIKRAASKHCTLEIDIETGRRGSRIAHVESLLCELTGAESAAVVNNNAAAVVLAIGTMAHDREVLISRGELVEIGGRFRMPDVIRAAGCRLVEVGTTNRTRISDYEAAITENTALILKVHPSNYCIVGFTEEASIEELVELGRKTHVPVMHDIGSGALIDLSQFGIKDEPMVQDSVRAGCDVVAFSGDKLMGSVQAGILVGKRESIEECRRNPLARALRVDKLTLAGLEATLRIMREPEDAIAKIPTLRYISRTINEIDEMAKKLADRLRETLGKEFEIATEESVCKVGGGSLPGQNLPSIAVAIRSKLVTPDEIAVFFRKHGKAIIGRVENDAFLLDMRTVESDEIDEIITRAQEISRLNNANG